MIIRVLLIAFVLFFATVSNTIAKPMHGFSLFGSLKYGAHFTHFDYANPNASKGGTLRLCAIGTFDSLNPFILKGNAAAGSGMPFESLMVTAGDERDAFYALVAENVEVLPQSNRVIFTLRKNARWHDQTPITADDVVFSHKTLANQGTPSYQNLLKEVEKVTPLPNNRIEFVFKPSKRRDLPTIAAMLPILSKKYYSNHPFDKTTLTPPLGSGAYQISKVEGGRSITFKRVEDYWGKDLPVNAGQYNFDAIQIDYYRDPEVALEAFKAGACDVRLENTAKSWAASYNFPAVAQKRVLREVLPNRNPAGLQAIFMNIRRIQFRDKGVREALALAFDFEWLNKNIFFNRYKRINSLFENTDYAAHSLPSPEETKLLTPFRKQLPPEVFSKSFALPVHDGSGNIRAVLKKSAALLNAAGWRVTDGTLKNDKNQVFTIELLMFDPTLSRVYQPYLQNLKKLGIEASIRIVDISQFNSRLSNFDFDMVSLRYPQSPTPGVEQYYFWGSTSAGLPGSPNVAGVQNSVVDALIDQLINANSQDLIRTLARTLDRVILWNYYFIPAWYAPDHFLAYWDKFGRPAILPLYGVMPNQSTFDPMGLLHLWWYDESKAKRLK